MAGRPLKFESVDALQTAIDEYFAQCVATHEPLTITGLALALDTTRRTLLDYENKDEYSHTIKRAKLRVENFAEKMLLVGKNQTGAIFALKNFDWMDTQTLAGDKNNPLAFKNMSEGDVDARILELAGKAGIAGIVGGKAPDEGEK